MRPPRVPYPKVFVGPTPKFWFTFVDAFGAEWHVYLGNEESIPQLEGADAVTLPKASIIGVREGLAPERRDMVLWHEMKHVAGSTSGDQHVLSLVFDCEPDKVDTVEENTVSFYAPREFAILHRNGLLRFPKVPK